MEDILKILLQFASLGGVAALLAAVVNVLKVFGLVKDGTAGSWSAALNLAALAVLVGLHFFAPQLTVEWLDAQAAMMAQILLIILGYVGQLGFSKFTHELLSSQRLPLIGFSRSIAAADEFVV